MVTDVSQERSRKESLKEAILNRRMLICVFTGFTSGMPLYVVFQLVPAWLRTEGVGLAEIGFFTLVQMPYIWKFLWSPVIDRYTLPFLGHRRGWMLVTQLAVMMSIAAMGFLEPALSIWTVAYLAAALAFFSASQDIVLDAYRRELLPDVELGLGNTIHVQAYRLSGLVPGALALILADHMAWHSVFIVVALFMLVGVILTLSIKEAVSEPSPPKTIVDAVINPFLEFFNRKGLASGLLVLAFLVLYKLGDSMATALQTPFFIDAGFSLTAIGTIAKLSGLIAAGVGAFGGAVVMIKLGINRALWVFGLVQIISITGFALLSELSVLTEAAILQESSFPNFVTLRYDTGADPVMRWMLGIVVGFEYLGVGLGGAAFVAFMARTTNPLFAATQFALFSALTAVPRTVIGAFTGVMVEYLGWTNFFLVCMVLAIPGMLLLFKVAPWNANDEIA
jgi:MFS transporter, PAT family, beta-lactamase induction signal transducer AmpG